MSDRPVVLVAFEEQDNLGIGYIASMLLQEHLEVRIVDFRIGNEAMLSALTRFDPVVVGFSVIFQHHIQRFRECIRFLRANGVGCHFTAGGHYPSLRYQQLLDLMPEIDSVVLFEGEVTFLELVRAVASGEEWRHVHGIAYRDGDGVTATPLRPLEPDLDRFPPPVRMPLGDFAFGRKFATILASRGCRHNCSFCSIQEFYRGPPGPVKRMRRPDMVVGEMEQLRRQRDCSVFMFQDDDFPVGRGQRAWRQEFCRLVRQSGLGGEVLWKINCRPDEVDRDAFAEMKACGLFLVYLGIESGTDDSLRLMDKHTSVDTNLKAAAILRELGTVYDFGFMLFTPYSTFESVAADLDFLDALCGDGSSPVTFCKMLPYAGTKVEKQLLAEGRLRGPIGHEDYDCLDPALDRLYALMARSFGEWIGDRDGLLNLARWARHNVAVARRLVGTTAETEAVAEETRMAVSESNRAFTDLARRMASSCNRQGEGTARESAADLENEAHALHQRYATRLRDILGALEGLGDTSHPTLP